MKTKIFTCLIALILCGVRLDSQPTPDRHVAVNRDGDSVLKGSVWGRAIRVLLSASKIDIGSPQEAPPSVRETNCTYSAYPCSQVRNIRIWVGTKELFVPRSAFADCSDIGTMALAASGGNFILTLLGGDGAEGYVVKIFFDAGRVKKREVYTIEGGESLAQTTTYMVLESLK